MSRKVIDNALDIHGGRGIQNGPNNYLANIFAGGPVAITVEGANILTRNLIIFGQGAIRCHPYILNEMQAVQDNSLKQFDQLLVKHIVYAASNVVRSLTFSLTNAFFVKTPTKKIIKPYYRQLTRMSSALAMVSDIAMLVLGGNLKRKESLSARLGDVLSALYLSSSVLKYFSDRNMPEDELPHVQWALDKQLANIQLAFNEFFDNFPTRWLAGLLRWIVFPYGRCYRGPSTNLSQKLAKHMMRLGESRDQLTKLCYIGAADQPLAILEQAVALQVATEPLLTKLKMAIKAGKVANNSNIEIRIKDAVVADIITEQEGQLLREYEIVRVQALSVDEFPADYFNKR